MGTNTAAARTLADALRGWSDDELRELLRCRPDLATPVPADTTVLAARAGTRASVVRAVDRIDLFLLTVLQAVVVAGSPASVGAIAPLVGADEPVVSDGVEALRRRALLWGEDPAVQAVRAVHECLGPHPAGLGPPATVALGSYGPDRIRTLARDTGVEPGADAVTTIGRIVASWESAGRLAALIDDAGEPAREVLARLAWGPPTGDLAMADRDVSLSSAASPVEQLLARGLLVAVDRRTVALPREVGLHLRGGRLLQHPVHRETALGAVTRDPAIVDRVGSGAAFEFVRRVELLLEAWGVAPPTVLRAGGLGIRELRRAAGLLDLDETTAGLHVETAREAGLVGTGEDSRLGEVWLPTDAFDAWLTSPTAQRWEMLARAWLESHRTAGLVGTRDAQDKPVNALSPDLERTSTAEIRRLTLDVLGALPPGQAASRDDVVARVEWYLPRRSRQRDRLARWTLDEAASIGVTALDAMTTHGRLMLNGQGSVEQLEQQLPVPVDHVLIQADLTAVAPGPLQPDLARRLALAADVESRGGATVYRFTPDSIRRALDAGWSAAELHDFLSARSSTPVPQPLTYLVDDVSRRHGQLRAGVGATYLRCDDEAQLNELMADQRVSGLRLRRIAPTVVLSDAPLDLLLARLRELGRSPVAEAPDGTVRVTRIDSRRAPPPRSAPSRAWDLAALAEDRLDAAVRALRAGDRVLEARPDLATVGRIGRTASSETLTRLREAVESGDRLWLGYVDRHGTVLERIVEPMRVEGGWLTAYDDRSEAVRTFAIHRISSVATVQRDG